MRWSEFHGDKGLREMCAYGAEQVRTKRNDGVRFNLWNLDEVGLVKTIMSELYPDVPYFCTWIKFSGLSKLDSAL